MNRRTFLLGAAAVPVIAALPEVAPEPPDYAIGVDHGAAPDRCTFTIWSLDGVVWRHDGLPAGYTVVVTVAQDPIPPE